MRFKDNEIILEKYLNNLDKFVLDFLKVLEKHSDYVIVSGYVSILFGRTRTTEDIDILVPKMNLGKFSKLQKHLKNKFWCLNSDDINEQFDMLNDDLSIRFAKKDRTFPNIEFKFLKYPIDFETFKKKIKVKIGKNIIFVSPIELQIAYKEKELKGFRDFEDALHLREVFKGKIKKDRIKYYEDFLRKNERQE